MQTHRLSPDHIKEFVLAGKALFTVLNTKTGGRFTFKVSKAASKDASGVPHRCTLWFVKVLTGPDNTSCYTFLGTFQQFQDGPIVYRHSLKAPIGEQAPSALGAAWLARRLTDGAFPPNMAVFHEGRCGRCGKLLTVPESVESGFGPECIKKVGGRQLPLAM